MEGTFEKFPYVEIVADATDPIYRVRVVDCVNKSGLVRFERREFRVPSKTLESFVSNLLGAAMQHGK